MAKNSIPFALAFLFSALLAGCHTPPTNIYQWGDYQPVIYKHFKGASPEEQIGILEENLEKARASGTAVPPGFHAHLGMLYTSIGKNDQGMRELMTEKKLFPESAPYMDFLMNKTTKKEQ